MTFQNSFNRLILNKFVLSILVLASAGWTWFFGVDLWSRYSGKAPMFDVVIDLSVGSESVEIRRRVSCLKKYQGEGLQYLFSRERPFIYQARDLSTGAHLENGQAILSIIPDACMEVRDAKKEGKTGNIASKTFLPMTALVDNFEDPQIIKVFGSRTYYERPDAEVIVNGYQIIPVEGWGFPDFKDEFDWLRGRSNHNVDYDSRLHFESAKLASIPLEVFRGAWTGNASFDHVTEPVSVFDVPGFSGPFKIFPPYGGFPFMGQLARNLPTPSEPYADPLSLDHVIPAVKQGNVYVYDDKDMGMLILRRTKGKRSHHSGKYSSPILGEIEEITTNENVKTTTRKLIVRVGDKNLPLLFKKEQSGGKHHIESSYFFYDPSTTHFYRLSLEPVSFPFVRGV